MKTKIVLLAFLLCLTQLVNAQTTGTLPYKHHFGIVASPTLQKVFTNNTSLPVGLIYKRQDNGRGMFRSSLISSQNSYRQSVAVPYSASDVERTGKGFTVQLTGGYEWHVPLSNKWLLYYGAEAGPSYGRSNSESLDVYTNSSSQGSISHSQQSTTFGAILRPLSGVAYQITDRLYITTETAIVASLYRSKNKMTDEQTTSANHSSTERSYKTDWSSISYKPISNISFLMRF
ncbi:hypothetical protein POKO110462_08740 [Pontibacter korlensis]|uniref:Outer membrane protein beta-barrel domain-containing protein n=1 Tax=Pontibacter korlensis TaxID=400092 RepID=A0A0E3ZE08_9BACT|nr:hypothetical protein [Pontibacter korlensis]AKD02590.1 hypothetical protein PKOR_04940 [Pontibacter korlensis]